MRTQNTKASCDVRVSCFGALRLQGLVIVVGIEMSRVIQRPLSCSPICLLGVVGNGVTSLSVYLYKEPFFSKIPIY